VKVSCAVCGRKMLTPHFSYNGKHYCRNHVPFGRGPLEGRCDPQFEQAFSGADRHWRKRHGDWEDE